VVRQISDRCVVMYAGRIVEAGPTQDVLDHPEHEYTRRLISAVPGPDWVPRRHASLNAASP
jgi:peptide/nickel transport system ATP-binding protein